jgi:ribosomal protein L31E
MFSAEVMSKLPGLNQRWSVILVYSFQSVCWIWVTYAYWRGAYSFSISTIYLCIWNCIFIGHNKEHNKVCQGHSERKKETRSKREMTQFLHDEMRTSSLDVRIENVVTFRLWSSGIGSVSTVVYLQPSDFQRLTVQEKQDQRKKLLPIIMNSLISTIFDSGIRVMSATFYLELIFKPWLWFWSFLCDLRSQFYNCLKEFVEILTSVQINF